MAAKPARSATRWDGGLSRWARISSSRRPELRGGPVAHEHDRARRGAAPARRRRGPVADLAAAVPGGDAHQPDRADQPVVRGPRDRQRDRLPGRRLGRREREEAGGVLARVRRRHPGPARDLRVLARGHESGMSASRSAAHRDLAVGQPRGGDRRHPHSLARFLPPCPPGCTARSPASPSGAPPPSSSGRRSATACSSPRCGARAATRRRRPAGDVGTPAVALIVAAYAEEAVIAAKVENALALDWPRDRLRVVVAVDGGAEPGADATAERARAAGADLVLELPRGGKVRAQDAAVAATARRADRLLRRQRALGARRAARAARAVRRSRRRLRLRPGPVRQRGRDQPGGRVLALRDVAARERVGARLGHGRERGDLRRAARRRTSTSTP